MDGVALKAADVGFAVRCVQRAALCFHLGEVVACRAYFCRPCLRDALKANDVVGVARFRVRLPGAVARLASLSIGTLVLECLVVRIRGEAVAGGLMTVSA